MITYNKLQDPNKEFPEVRQERYYLLRQKERLHPLCHNVYLNKQLEMTVMFNYAGLFTAAELNDLPEEIQETYVAILETKLLKDLESTTHD